MPPHNPDQIEEMCDAAGCDAPRVTQDLIRARIKNVEYQKVRLCGTLMMFCGIQMDNGFVVTGKPAVCVNEANWRDEIGEKITYDNAFAEIWKFEGYRLATDQLNARMVETLPVDLGSDPE